MTTAGGYAAVRPHVIPDSLEELTGPADGGIVLPVRLDWGPERIYRLSESNDVHLLYERVIREALRADDLQAFLNSTVLRQIWAELFLPIKLKRLWEERFPTLVARVA